MDHIGSIGPLGELSEDTPVNQSRRVAEQIKQRLALVEAEPESEVRAAKLETLRFVLAIVQSAGGINPDDRGLPQN